MMDKSSRRIGIAIAAGLFLNAGVGVWNIVFQNAAIAQNKSQPVYLTDSYGSRLKTMPVFLTNQNGYAESAQPVSIQSNKSSPMPVYLVDRFGNVVDLK